MNRKRGRGDIPLEYRKTNMPCEADAQKEGEWMVIGDADMPGGLDAEIRRGLCLVFPADVAVYTHTRAWHDSGPSLTVAFVRDGVVLAHVGMVDRVVGVGAQSLRAAGVQNVYSLPEARGGGLAREALRRAMEAARGHGFDIGLLFCVPGLEAMYASFGWIGVGGREVIRVEDGAEKGLPKNNVAMFFPLKTAELPVGALHLRGNDW